ncbi:hypothetical protein ACROYT_G029130 [Oculina patagonica]
MASAASSFPSTKETTNYARLCRLLVDVGSQVLRETFDRVRPPGSLHTVLSDPAVHAKLQSLRKKKVLNPSQWGKLYPAIKSSVSSRDFDTTLLVLLLRNICSLVPPATGWDNLPLVTDVTPEADIARIKFHRNTVYGHATEASVDDATFGVYWNDIRVTLVRLGGANYQDAINDLEKECMDPDFEEHYRDLLRQWVKDEASIKDKLDELNRKLEDFMSNTEKRPTLEAVSAYTSALKASIKSQTEFQPKLMASPTISNPRTDDIFTNLLIQHGRKALYKNDMTSARGELLDYYGQVSGTRVKNCEEVFICRTDGEPNPKSILVTGKAGIGKTLFSQKLVRDWADDKLFQSQANLQNPDIKFAYLLTFRQLNLLGNDLLSFQELLNRSSTLDEKSSNIDNSLFEYLVNHPEEVLIILDGYDEYSQRDYIAGNSEEQYPNNASEEMPVAALCAKLIKGRMMRESVVMITSRPDESDKMGGIHFDRYVEITGFSPEQVKEYIEKYFRKNETMKNTVLEHVMNNENLVSFAHIPVLCFLMCFYLEYTLQESKSTDLPMSATDIYSDVVNIFELKHNAESEYKSKEIPEEHKASDDIESTLDKLSELAAQLLLQQRPIFDERDMKEKFKAEEIEKLKGSGLLHCGPPFRKSAFETTKQLSFTHLTIQEFLAARWFVMRNEIPKETVSEMVMLFIAGILSKKRSDKLMERLLESISITREPLLLKAKLLSEYQHKEFAKNVIKKYPHHYHSDQDGQMSFKRLNDLDCIAVSFLLDVISELNEEDAATAQRERRSEQSCSVNSLWISFSALTLSGIKQICESLEKKHCAITKLLLWMAFNHFSDTVIIRLCEALQHPSCKVTTLDLRGNDITDTGVARLCEALQHPSCKVTTLKLSGIQIADTGVTRLCEALQHSSCKVTTLNLMGNQITDTGVTRLCEALQHPSCKVTTLNLSGNQIADTGVTRLCEALQHPSCKVTTLDLSQNQITDTGVTRLCEALQHPSCKITTLDLSQNQITDTGVTRLCKALQHSSCKVTTLNLIYNEITDTDVARLCEAGLKIIFG